MHHRHDGRSVVRSHAANPEAPVDGEPAKSPLLLRRQIGRGHGCGNELRPVDQPRFPFGDDGGGPRREHVLDPVRTRPVGKGDDEPVAGRERHNRRFVRSSSLPADVSDHRGVRTRRPGRLHLVRVPEGPVEPANRVLHEGGLRPHPDEEDDPDHQDHDEQADEDRRDRCPHDEPPPWRARPQRRSICREPARGGRLGT